MKEGVKQSPFCRRHMGWSLTERRLDRTWHDMSDRLGDKTTNWRCSCRPCPRSDSYSRRGVQRSDPYVCPPPLFPPQLLLLVMGLEHWPRKAPLCTLSLYVAVKINRWRSRSIAEPSRLPLGCVSITSCFVEALPACRLTEQTVQDSLQLQEK